MGNTSKNYNGIEKYIFRDAYYIFLKFKDIGNINEYWNVLNADADTFVWKYKNHPLAQSIINAVVEQLKHKNLKTVLDGFTYQQWDENLEVAKKTEAWNPNAWKYN